MIIRVDSVSGLKSFRETQPERLSSPRVARESTASTLVSPPESTTPEQGVSESTPPPLYRGGLDTRDPFHTTPDHHLEGAHNDTQ